MVEDTQIVNPVGGGYPLLGGGASQDNSIDTVSL